MADLASRLDAPGIIFPSKLREIPFLSDKGPLFFREKGDLPISSAYPDCFPENGWPLSPGYHSLGGEDRAFGSGDATHNVPWAFEDSETNIFEHQGAYVARKRPRTWARFRTRQGAINLHPVLTEVLPQCLLISDGKTHDRRAVQDLKFESGDLLIFDRAHLDNAWLYRLQQGGVWFVTRLNRNSCFEVIKEQRVSEPVPADQVIRLSSPQSQASYPKLLRRVHYCDPKAGKEYVFLINRLDLSAQEVAELYRCRWQIELFFKWIKQNLKIKAFYGTSRNGLLIQLWTALIACLLLVWLPFQSRVRWGLLELTRLAQTLLMERCNWGLILNTTTKAPPRSWFFSP